MAGRAAQVAITVGIPILSAIAATQSVRLTGIHLVLGVDMAVTLASVVVAWFPLRLVRRAAREFTPGRVASSGARDPRSALTAR
jgi:hypothetical protein